MALHPRDKAMFHEDWLGCDAQFYQDIIIPRASLKKTLSSHANQRQFQDSVSGKTSKSDEMFRTVEIDIDSMSLTKSSSAKESLNRTNVLGFTENYETLATVRAQA